MNVAIRADASTRMGLGHLSRCRTLAAALREQGAHIRFICRQHPGHQLADLIAEGYPVAALPAPPVSDANDGDYASWLGLSQSQDAAESIDALAGERPDWLIVDHYGLDADWERALRSSVERLLVIDDLANRPHDCDLLLDQNYTADAAQRYAGLLPQAALGLFGPHYALLRPEYARHRERMPTRDGKVRRLLVFFGGTDPDNLTGLTLAALNDPALAHLRVDLVIGANNPHRARLCDEAAARQDTRVHLQRPHLADLMADADLGIGAGGATTWERCCLGLPTIVASIAENQQPACAALAADGLIHYLGHRDEVSTETLGSALLELIANPAGLQQMSQNGWALVDGGGGGRVIDAMRQNNGQCLTIVAPNTRHTMGGSIHEHDQPV